MENAQQIGKLLFLYMRKELSESQKAELAAWRKESAANEAFFQEEMDPDNIRQTTSDIQGSRKRVFQKIKLKYPGAFEKEPKHLWYRLHIPAWAAAAIFILVLGSGIYLLIQKNSHPIQPARYQASLINSEGVVKVMDDMQRGFQDGYSGTSIEIDKKGNRTYIPRNDSISSKDGYNILRTPRGGHFSIQFPDGTRLWLNAQSSVRYPVNFNQDSIHLIINGEAYIEVARTSVHPLIISLASNQHAHPQKDSAVKADQAMQMATSNSRLIVSNYEEGPSIFALTLQGNLQVLRNEGNSVQLIPNQKAVLTNKSFTIVPLTDTTEIIAWKTGRIYYKDAKINTILQDISRWYDVDILYPDSIPEKHFHLDLSREADISDLLSALRKQGLHIDLRDRSLLVWP